MTETSRTRLDVFAAFLGLSSAGCSDQDELEIIEVETATNNGNVVFSWPGGNAHGLTVRRCEQECNGCVDGVLDYGVAEVLWEAAEYPTGPADLVSPLTYGESPDGGSAQALVSGVTYGVEIFTNADCDASGCGTTLVQGCGEFVAP